MKKKDENIAKPSRLWSVKYFFQKTRFKIFERFHRFARSRKIALIVPPITGAYYLTLDVWGDKIAFISNNESIHKKVFFACLGVSLAGLFVRGFVDDKKDNDKKDANALLADFLRTVGIIVEEKLNRFRNKLTSAEHVTDKFSHITNPKDQLHVIYTNAAQFASRAFSIDENEIDITVMHKSSSGKKWQYGECFQKWKRADADFRFQTKSAVRECIETGEAVFFADKIAAAKKGQYKLSDRDKRRVVGSVYIMPIFFSSASESYTYVISIITYGKQLCCEWDEEGKSAVESFLREICRRIEVELALNTIGAV